MPKLFVNAGLDTDLRGPLESHRLVTLYGLSGPVGHARGREQGYVVLRMRRKPYDASRRVAIRRSITVLIALIALAAVVAVPALAASSDGKVNVPKKFKKHIPKVKEKSGLPVLLPQKMWVPVRPSRSYPASFANEKGYTLELDAARGCNGANVCFLAQFSGTRGGEFSFKRKVKLTHGLVGRFYPVHCGASCAPAFIQWKEFGVLYEIQDKGVGRHEKRWMQKLANSAIRNGPR
jgi:hypothetical protein